MGGFSLTHWLIVLVIVVLLFGTSKLKNLGSDLGEAVKGFKKGMAGDEQPKIKNESADKSSDKPGDSKP